MARASFFRFNGGPLDGGSILWPRDRVVPDFYWFDHLDQDMRMRHMYKGGETEGRVTQFQHRGLHENPFDD